MNTWMQSNNDVRRSGSVWTKGLGLRWSMDNTPSILAPVKSIKNARYSSAKHKALLTATLCTFFKYTRLYFNTFLHLHTHLFSALSASRHPHYISTCVQWKTKVRSLMSDSCIDKGTFFVPFYPLRGCRGPKAGLFRHKHTIKGKFKPRDTSGMACVKSFWSP